MTDLRWYEAFPPRGCSLADVTALVRPLAGRARLGIWRTTPIVVFELWIEKDAMRWLIGVDQRLRAALPAQLIAQMPRLSLADASGPRRPALSTGMIVRSAGMSYALRLDTATAVAAACAQIASGLGKREAVVIQWIVGPSAPRHVSPSQPTLSETLGLRTPRKPDATEQRAWRAKIEEPLFGVQGRIGVLARHIPRQHGLLHEAFNALSLANGPHARLRAGRASPATAQRLRAVGGSRRSWSSVVNATELAALLSWPLDNITVPGRPAVPGKAPAALLFPSDSWPPDQRVLGASLHPADGGQLVTMPAASSAYHLHIIGPTGSGKSNLLAQLILSDAAAGHSILVIEPKGDLVRDVLARLPEDRHHQVVVIEPSDAGPVIGFNPLAGPPAEAERRADELLHLFRELFGTAIGPRSADVLLHSLITAARLPDGTLTDLPVLLTNPQFRRRALSKVNDPLVLGPFWARFDGLSEAERGQVIAPLLNKLRAFLSRTALRRILSQAQPMFALEELFASRRIVLVNLNKGLIGPETAKLLGSLLLTQCWQAIQRRALQATDKRHPVMVTLDEWQDVAGALDFGDVLAQARGLGVGFTLAHQHLDQLGPSLSAAALANARSRIAFRPAQKDLKTLAAVLGDGLTPDDLEQLGAYEACARLLVDAALGSPFGIRTLPLPKGQQNAAMLRRASQERFGRHPAALDEALRARWQGGDQDPDGRIGVSPRRSS